MADARGPERGERDASRLNIDALQQEIAEMWRRANGLKSQAVAPAQDSSLFERVYEELQTTLEELQTTVDEIRILQAGEETMERPAAASLLVEPEAARDPGRLPSPGARLTALYEANSDAILLIDLRGRIVSANSACELLLGYVETELKGALFADLFPREDRERAAAYVESTLRGQRQRAKRGVLRLEGRRTTAETTLIPVVENGQCRGAYALVKDMTDRQAAEDALQVLTRFGELVGTSLDLAVLVEQIMRLCVPVLGRTCALYMVELDGQARLYARLDADEPEICLGSDLVPTDPAHPIRRALRTRQPVFLPASPRQGDAGEEHGLPVPALVLPMVVRGRTMGAIAHANPVSDSFSPSDLRLATDLARRTGRIIDLIQRCQREQLMAQTLQRSFLPHRLPELPGLEIGQAFLPCEQQVLIGAGFYDLFELDEGRIGVVIGDVCGKGTETATPTMMTRYTLHAIAMDQGDTAVVLSRLDRLLQREFPEDRFVTLFYGVLDTRKRRLAYANGGHEPPVIERANGRIEPLESTGPPLGSLKGSVFVERIRSIDEGDSLLLFSDTLREVRCEGELLDHSRLNELLTATRGEPAARRVEEIAVGIQRFATQPLHGDIGLLLIHLRP